MNPAFRFTTCRDSVATPSDKPLSNQYLVISPADYHIFEGVTCQIVLPQFKRTMGTIRIELFESDAPKTTENFTTLAERGYYDGVIFHRVIKGFMIQGGDPTGTGRGGESAWGGRFNDEIDASSAIYQRGYKKGTVAMANAGPNTNGSQFFIMHADYPLPPSYTIFGRVTDGIEVVDQSRPLKPIAAIGRPRK